MAVALARQEELWAHGGVGAHEPSWLTLGLFQGILEAQTGLRHLSAFRSHSRVPPVWLVCHTGGILWVPVFALMMPVRGRAEASSLAQAMCVMCDSCALRHDWSWPGERSHGR